MGVVLSMLVLLLAVVAVQVQFAYRKRQLFRQNWDGILSRVETVDLTALRLISDTYLTPGKDQLRIDPAHMWAMIGGLGGLQRMHRNADTMLELARYAEQWDTENCRVVAETMRRDSMRFKKAALNIEMALVYSFGIVRANFSLQEVASSYCLMRERLMGLYHEVHVGRIPQLESVL